MDEDNLLNDAFVLPSKANSLEDQFEREGRKDDSILIQASSTYFEAVYLLKRYLNRLPFDPSSPRSSGTSRTRQLLKEKIRHYESVAANLLNRLGSGSGSQSAEDQAPHHRNPCTLKRQQIAAVRHSRRHPASQMTISLER